jgi:hypothetical protein
VTNEASDIPPTYFPSISFPPIFSRPPTIFLKESAILLQSCSRARARGKLGQQAREGANNVCQSFLNPS